MPVPQKDGPRANRDIRGVRDVQLIDQEGQNRGAIPFVEALRIAEDAGLDLVEIAPNSVPPVCKLLDYGRFRFLEQKKQAEARKKQKTVEVKEIKLRPGIDKHDYDVKMKAVHRFFEEGDKVKEGEIIDNGFITLPDRDGLGVEMNDDAARKAQVPGTPWFEKV